MITKQTVLVLEAGASQPYGFPLGPTLKDKILESVTLNELRARYAKVGYSDEVISHFRDILTESPYDTIDAILTQRPSLTDIGRFAIALVLARHEIHEKVMSKKDWYRHLYHRLRLDDSSVNSPPLSIVTFNYDRSLEHYFARIFETALEGEGRRSAEEKFDSIPNRVHNK